MAGHNSGQKFFPSPNSTRNYTNKPISSFLGSPRIFSGFLARSLSDSETMTSPNSILDCKQTFNRGNPFGFYRNKSSNPITIPIGKKPSKNKQLESESIGLALIDSKESTESSSKDYNKSMVLFGAKLRVEIPCFRPSSVELPQVKNTTRDVAEAGLNFTEMESSEDYTCVITHGPNPKTTHIYDNCIVESCCGVRKLGDLIRENGPSSGESTSSPGIFWTSCHSCKVDRPVEAIDINMYRGEGAICRHECRCQEMVLGGQSQESGNR